MTKGVELEQGCNGTALYRRKSACTVTGGHSASHTRVSGCRLECLRPEARFAAMQRGIKAATASAEQLWQRNNWVANRSSKLEQPAAVQSAGQKARLELTQGCRSRAGSPPRRTAPLVAAGQAAVLRGSGVIGTDGGDRVIGEACK